MRPVSRSYVSSSCDVCDQLCFRYEKKHPGRIARKKLPCKQISVDGKTVEVVVLRVTPKDEWEGEFAEVLGVDEQDEYEDGAMVLNNKQSERKFNALAGKARISQEVEDAEVVETESSAPSESERSDHESAKDASDESNDRNEDVDMLGWAASCLLDEAGEEANQATKAKSLTPTKSHQKSPSKAASSQRPTSASAAKPSSNVVTAPSPHKYPAKSGSGTSAGLGSLLAQQRPKAPPRSSKARDRMTYWRNMVGKRSRRRATTLRTCWIPK